MQVLVESSQTKATPIPSLPIMGWEAFVGSKRSAIPSLLNADSILYTTSGRAAIYHALKLLGVSSGRSVIIPSYHCPSMVSPVVALGADPIFCPIGRDGEILVDRLDRLVRADTLAILAPQYFGLPRTMSDVRAWCDDRKIALIEDCAHSLFGVCENRGIGQWGDLAIGSLTKFLPVPEGGCLVYNRSGYERVELSDRSLVSQIKSAVDIVEEGAKYHSFGILNIPLNSIFKIKKRLQSFKKIDGPELAESENIFDSAYYKIDIDVANLKLTYPSNWVADNLPLQRIVDNRRKNYRFLASSLGNSSRFYPLQPELPDYCAPYVFPLWVNNPDPAYMKMRSAGIPLYRWDRLWPTTPDLDGDSGKMWSSHIFQLICHQDLREADIQRIVDKVDEICV